VQVRNGKKEFHIAEKPQFNTIGPMFDLSSNISIALNDGVK